MTSVESSEMVDTMSDEVICNFFMYMCPKFGLCRQESRLEALLDQNEMELLTGPL